MIQFYGEVKKEGNSYPKAIKELREMLEQEQPELEAFLLTMWNNQQKEIIAKQYIEMVQKGSMTKEIEKKILESNSICVLGHVLSKKEKAMKAGAKEVKKPLFSFDMEYKGTQKWIEKSCAEQIVQLTNTQKEAIKLVIDRAAKLNMTPDETANLIKPMIGLHKGQVTANINYYNSIKQNMLQNNPRMKETTAEKKALEKAKQYAKKQKEHRAMNIARTELAGAYNAGEFYGIKQAQKEGLMGKVKKYAISAGDNRTCKGCREVEGQEINQDDYFETQWGNVLFPPFHVDCRCAVGYEEISEPEEITPTMPTLADTQQNDTISTEESDDFLGSARRGIKGVIAGGKIIKYDELPKNIREPFEQGLKNAAPMTKTILEREMKNVDYVIKNGKNNAYSPFFEYIRLKKNAIDSTIAHELFHRIDYKYNVTGAITRVTKKYVLDEALRQDYERLLYLSENNIIGYLQKNYKNSIRYNRKNKVKLKAKYRGISDIFNGLTNSNLHLGYGHEKSYWEESKMNLQKEAWAQYGRITYSNDEEVMKMFQELFPNFYKSATIKLEEVIQNVGR